MPLQHQAKEIETDLVFKVLPQRNCIISKAVAKSYPEAAVRAIS